MALGVADPAIELDPITGDPHSLAEWLTLFNLLVVVLDPYTRESGWIIETAGRLFRLYEEADVRVGFVVTGDEDGARQYLGPYADEFLVLVDPDRDFVRSLELERLPALVHITQDCTVEGSAEGWKAEEWEEVLAGVEASHGLAH